MSRGAAKESERLAALSDLAITGTPAEAHFDAVCRLARDLFNVPIALISIVGADRQWFKAKCGTNMSEGPRAGSFCTYTIASDEVFIVEDAAADPRFATSAFVQGDPGIRFYAGAPLVLQSGAQVGALCIKDTAPRSFSDEQRRQLRDLAEIVVAHLRLHQSTRASEVERLARCEAQDAQRDAEDAVQASEASYRLLAHNATDLVVRRSAANVRTYVSPSCSDLLGYTPDEFLALSLSQTFHPDDALKSELLMSDLLAGRIEQCRVTHRNRHKDGRWIWVEANCRLVRDETGAPHEVISTVRDITERRAAEDALRESEARYRALADTLPQMVWVSRASDGAKIYANQRFRDFAGSGTSGCDANIAAHHPDDQERAARGWAEASATGRTFEIEARWRGAGETYRWHKIVIVPVTQDGEVVEWIGTALDIDDLVTAKCGLEATTELLRLAQEAAGAGMWDWDFRSDLIRHSTGSARMHGFDIAPPLDPDGSVETHALDFAVRIHPDDFLPARQAALRAVEQRAFYSVEYRVVRPDADDGFGWVQSFGRVICDKLNGEPIRLVGLNFDVTDRKAAEGRIAHMALHDALTGLPNRNLFSERLDQALCRAAQTPNRYAVLALDLDHFKSVNDTYGHPAGDRLLSLVGERIRAAVRDQDTVARLGGDEFAVILSDIDGGADVRHTCERIIAALDETLLLDGAMIDIGVSIGAALVSDDGVNAEGMFQRADMALYQAKAANRNTYRLYEAEAHARTATRSLLALDMKEAIRRGDFFLVYQPIIDVTTDSIVSFEALMRWQHPVHGSILPIEFIPVAEETGLIVPLGAWALREACTEALNWPTSVRVSVNVSAVQFRGGLEEAVVTALSATGLPAQRLKLEVTESLLLHNPEQVVAVLHRLRGLGVRIALDDFGTGYSSLSYLRMFPFDKIKIDRAFVRDIVNPDAAAIVRAMVGIGERLGMGIVAEGVETPEQLDLVRREGCTEVQGYIYSKPLSAIDAQAFIRDGQNIISVVAA